MPKRKVLIITYYWPPSGGSGVQRWVKFAKYMHAYGWEPIIYSPKNPETPEVDNSLNFDIPENIKVLKKKIWEPHHLYKKLVGLKKENKLGSGLMKSGNENSLLHKLAIWIRGNLFIPDSRKFWIRPSIDYLSLILKNEKIDAIISTGPPHSMHLIAMQLSKKFFIPWVADFRDPWTNIDFINELNLSRKAWKKHHFLEKTVLNSADKILVVSNTMKTEFQEFTKTPIEVITNGFDTSDYRVIDYTPNSKFVLAHIGMLTSTRNPSILWEVLQELKNEHHNFAKNFTLKLIGRVDSSIYSIIAEKKIEDIVQIIDYIPHKEVTSIQQSSESLLLIINNTPNASLLLTGKIFEYMAANRPIICITPVFGDASKVLNDVGIGSSFLYSEKDKLKIEIINQFNKWESGSLEKPEIANIKDYSRKHLTKKLVEQLNQLDL